MTSAGAAFPGGGSSVGNRIASYLAHYTPLLYVVGVIYYAWAFAVTRASGFGWYLVMIIPFAVIILSASMLVSWHVYALCPACARRVPLDPAAAVARKRSRLSLLHWLLELHPREWSWFRTGLLILACVPHVVVPAFFAFFLTSALSSYLINVHLPLQPWCPFCDWDGGDEEEVVPDPVPDRGALRTR